MARVLVAAVKPWNVRRYYKWAKGAGHETRLVQEPKELTAERVAEFHPDFIFFPHWSWKISRAVYESYECVLFHMTDLPYGRGGSPLQNLLLRGVDHTQVSALRVTGGIDAGPIYLKRPVCLHGGAQEIFERVAEVVFGMIDEILERRPAPVPQTGEVVEFKRRTPADSEIPEALDLRGLYNFIRMLDAETYPAAFLRRGGFRYEFSRVTWSGEALVADVRISRGDEEGA